MNGERQYSGGLSHNICRNPWILGWSRFYRNKSAMIGLVVFLLICLACVLLPDRIKWNYFQPDFADSLKPPDPEHIFGLNVLGRDMLSGVLYGGRITLRIAATAALLAMLAGCAIGLISGYFGGKIDFLLSRLLDIISSVPVILLVLAVEYMLDWGEGNFGYAIAISAAPQFARLIRASVLDIMSCEYIEAAIALGFGHIGIIRRRVLRNVMIPNSYPSYKLLL